MDQADPVDALSVDLFQLEYCGAIRVHTEVEGQEDRFPVPTQPEYATDFQPATTVSTLLNLDGCRTGGSCVNVKLNNNDGWRQGNSSCIVACLPGVKRRKIRSGERFYIAGQGLS